MCEMVKNLRRQHADGFRKPRTSPSLCKWTRAQGAAAPSLSGAAYGISKCWQLRRQFLWCSLRVLLALSSMTLAQRPQTTCAFSTFDIRISAYYRSLRITGWSV